ncbi:MAG TPA: 4-hydroxy-tetrahydrodipicolinate synthase [Firmicutes bacterium]|nr:4-hydroxy-tetrahydrodipicolinate synthase [Bacillota bacterium]
MDFGRILTAMVTPFNEDGSVDYEGAKKLAKYLVANGSDALVVSGTTGEAPTLTSEEKLQLFSEIKDTVDVPVIAGSSSNDTVSSIEFSKEAAKIADGLLLVVPYYNKPTQEGLYLHFASIAKEVDKPCILYNVPGRTGKNLEVETVERLAELPNIVGVKEAGGDLGQAARIVSSCPRLRIYSGDDALTLPMCAVGGYGVISVASHIVGSSMQRMLNFFESGNVERAAKLHRELLPIFEGLFITSNPIPVKYLLYHLGIIDNLVYRLPLTPPNAKEKEFLEKLVANIK